jgi:hypothetical protein
MIMMTTALQPPMPPTNRHCQIRKHSHKLKHLLGSSHSVPGHKILLVIRVLLVSCGICSLPIVKKMAANVAVLRKVVKVSRLRD